MNSPRGMHGFLLDAAFCKLFGFGRFNLLPEHYCCNVRSLSPGLLPTLFIPLTATDEDWGLRSELAPLFLNVILACPLRSLILVAAQSNLPSIFDTDIVQYFSQFLACSSSLPSPIPLFVFHPFRFLVFGVGAGAGACEGEEVEGTGCWGGGVGDGDDGTSVEGVYCMESERSSSSRLVESLEHEPWDLTSESDWSGQGAGAEGWGGGTALMRFGTIAG